MGRIVAWIVVVAVLVGGSAPAAEKALKMEDFLRAMVDLRNLPRLTDGVTCKQWSSYDRASKTPDDMAGWTANGDAGQFLRNTPEEGAVLGEMNGPGCITCIWSANPAGQLQIYLDGETKPTIDIPLADIFDKDRAPYPFGPPLSYQHSGADSYVPIPYAKSCKIVVRNPGTLYYHIDYLTFPKDTQVETFSWALSSAARQELTTVKAIMDEPEMNLQTLHPAGAKDVNVSKKIQAGSSATLFEASTPGTISAIRLKVTSTEANVLRKCLIRMYWDGSLKPSVECPLGDFFGTGFAENPYRSLPMGMTKDFYYCFFAMPYNQARIEILNQGTESCKIEGTFTNTPSSTAQPESMGRFFAKWRRENGSATYDYPFLVTEGHGKYIGTALAIDNPRRQWWGEGDEKVWVDGESFPSWYGTGSEDYFADAWGFRPHVRPYEGCTRLEGPDWANKDCVYRWHIADAIPFARSYRMTIENYAALDTKDVDYASVAYWYQDMPVRDFFKPTPVADRIPRPFVNEGIVEGESLKILEVVGGTTETQELGGFHGGAQLFFSAAKAGDSVTLELPIENAGKYHVYAYFCKAPDYATFDMFLDGKQIGTRYDAYADAVTPSERIDLGVQDLKKGSHKLKFVIAGQNAKSKGFFLGFDALQLTRE